VSSDIGRVVADAADRADLHAPVPALLLELQSLLGAVTATVTTATQRGRRPFRPGPEWPARLGELAYGLYLLADQTGIDLDQAVRVRAEQLHRTGQAAQRDSTGWPFGEH
jgi:hypothetical protein